MKKRLLRITNVLLLPILFLLLMAVGMNGKAQDNTSGSTSTATISIDKLDYAPGEVVQITGTGWIGDDVVYLQVFNETYPALNGTDHYMYWEVYPDPITGNFTSSWDVTIDELNTSLKLTADGKKSGFKYQVFFTDSKILFQSAAVTGTSTICSGESSVLSLAITTCTQGGNARYSIDSYQWQQSTNNSSWSDIAGATSSTFSANPGTTTYYRCVITLSSKQDFCTQPQSNTPYITPSFTLTVNASPIVTCPTNVTISSCTYSNQTALNNAFAAWLATASATNGTLTNNNAGAPNICEDSKTIRFTSTSDNGCGTSYCDAKFTLTKPDAIAYTAPVGTTKTSCQLASQTAVNDAFAAWVSAQTTALNVSGGCNPQVSNNSADQTIPVLCNGGEVEVTWTIKDLCETITKSAKFTLTGNLAPTITSIPANQTRSTNSGQCTYSAVGTEFDITATDDCGTTYPLTKTYSLSGATSGTGSNSLEGIQFNFGETTIIWTVTDRCGLTDVKHFMVNVNKVTTVTSVTVTPSTQQYSDKVTFVATVTNCPLAGTSGTVEFKVGTQGMGSAPVLSDGTATLANVALLETTPNGQMAPTSPGTRIVTATYSGSTNYSGSTGTTNLTITPEDASITYNGGTYFGANPNTGQGIISLSAYVLDAEDGARGDIRNATATFHDGSQTGADLGTANIPVGLVSVNTWEGSVGTDFDYTLTNSDISSGGKNWTVWTTVDKYYQGVDEATTVTLAMPGADYVTGGGHIIMSKSYGTYPGLNGKKMNFGLTMKWNKSGKNLQGNVNIIYRGMYNGQLVNFQIKSNAINSLSVVSIDVNGAITNTASKIVYKMATVNTKANLQVIYPDGTTTSLGGNLALLITAYESATDNTGKSDKIAVQLSPSSGSGMIFSSNWSGSKTVEQLLNGGKIQAMDAATKSAEILPDQPVSEVASVKAYPNPFTDRVAIEFNSATDCNATLEIYSITGAKLATLFNAPIEAGVLYKVDYIPNLVSSQVVLYHLTIDGKTAVGKLIYREKN